MDTSFRVMKKLSLAASIDSEQPRPFALHPTTLQRHTCILAVEKKEEAHARVHLERAGPSVSLWFSGLGISIEASR